MMSWISLRLKPARWSWTHTNFNFQHVITQALELVSPKAQAKGLEMLLTMLGDVPYMIKGDPGRLRQVLVNLLSNAVKFTQKGRGGTDRPIPLGR
jgi:signal transduction histidine kinase